MIDMSKYFKVSALTGPSLDDCAFMVLRSEWDDYPDDESTQWMIVRRRGQRMSIVGRGEWLPEDLWMSPAGTLYFVGTMDGRKGLHRGIARGAEYIWSRVEQVTPDRGSITLPHGVWGLSDDYLYCWGGGWLADDPNSAHLDQALTWFFDGKSWHRAASSGVMLSVHGADRESIFAVGHDGLVARWGGEKWIEMARPARAPLGYLHVESATEAYAITVDGDIFEGSVHGWHELAVTSGYVNGIVKWSGDVLIATQHNGFQKLDGNRVLPFVDHLRSYVFHAGKTLMWTNGGGILETTDFSSFAELDGQEIGELVNANYFPY